MEYILDLSSRLTKMFNSKDVGGNINIISVGVTYLSL